MMKEYKGDFVAIGLDCKGAKQNFLDTSTNVARMTSFHIDQLPPEDSKNWTRKQWDAISTFLEENRQNIFYLFVFYVVTIALFVERFIREYLVELLFNAKFQSPVFFHRLFFYGGTYGSQAHNGRGNRRNQRISSRIVLLLQSSTINDVA